MAGKGNNLASLPYFCEVSLDVGVRDTALGELGKYEEGWSGKSQLGQIIAYPYHTKDSFIHLCLEAPVKFALAPDKVREYGKMDLRADENSTVEIYTKGGLLSR